LSRFSSPPNNAGSCCIQATLERDEAHRLVLLSRKVRENTAVISGAAIALHPVHANLDGGDERSSLWVYGGWVQHSSA
jgi:hypothetical protein